MKNQLDKQNKLKKTNDHNNKLVCDFIETFTKLNGREPIESEIIDNVKEKIDINIIQKILDEKNNRLSELIYMDSENLGINMV